MKFHVVLLQGDGSVTDTRVHDTEIIFADAAGRKTVSYFDRLIRAKLSDNPGKTGNFTTSIDADGRYLLNWAQAVPTSAMATIFVRKKLAAVTLFLYGFEPISDTAVVNSTAHLLDDLFKEAEWMPVEELRTSCLWWTALQELGKVARSQSFRGKTPFEQPGRIGGADMWNAARYGAWPRACFSYQTARLAIGEWIDFRHRNPPQRMRKTNAG